ncbi:peptidase inhibitor family I36 protein [Microbacterium sp. No. 7]|uniref:peptidase inhibitor family I36 protein n=1 Tax=Microbacterium sp. No. 7 TaxID=1714373 RepID=UPI0006D17CC0|nr:peptidase inhibitor family I36 protein [Microbacterium sp. No. 7]ALJ19413.1 hypothetical protein AOA12_05630 [Microbacterium sp. No. 7]
MSKNTIVRRLSAGVGALVASAVLVTGTAAPAFAGYYDCRPEKICLFEHINYGGGLVDGTQAPNLSWLRFNDKASSTGNRSGTSRHAYQHADYKGYALKIWRESQTPDLRKLSMSSNENWNDKISSFR